MDEGTDQLARATDRLTKETEAVKKLLILLLVKVGSDSSEIAMALGIADSTVRKMISIRKVKKIGVAIVEKQ